MSGPSVEGEGHRPLWDLPEAMAFWGKLSQGTVQVGDEAGEWEDI